MKKSTRFFKRTVASLLGILMFSQAFCLPALAETKTAPASDLYLANADIQVSDDYLPEIAYTSEIENPELADTDIGGADYYLETEPREYPDGLVQRATVGDPMVYLTQVWLNQEYGDVPGFGEVEVTGRTGWDTVYGLLRALQHELGITDLANNFGSTTERLYSQNPLHRQDGVTNRKFAILQGALWCKGYSPGYHLRENADGTVEFDEVFDAGVEAAVIELKQDAGLTNPDGVVTTNVMKALMSMDSFKLLTSYGGDTKVRTMQQKLNRKYEEYAGLNPCDGVYGRNTNKALIYALQAEEGLPTSVANGNFGVTTKLCCPEIPYARNSKAARRYPGTSSGSYYTSSQISALTELLQFALYVNGFGDGVTDGVFDSATKSAIRAFQKEYAINQSGVADKSTWLSLFISCGDTSRTAKAADCATILTAPTAKSLYDNGYRYIGRYLTGTYNGGISKALTVEEANIIFDAGLNFFPIYQTSARSQEYFTEEQGEEDAYAAIEAASKLGIPKNTIIYFAVDFDAMDYQITSNVIPYFKNVHRVMSDSIYQTGIYGTRNACTRVSELGYACSSFVGDMSTGFSGNLGYSMPKNWAFDQFVTTTIGSGTGRLEIDKDGFSGRDHGVSKLTSPISNPKMPDITFGTSTKSELLGPVIDILGYETPLFTTPVGLNMGVSKELIQTNYDVSKGTIKVTVGLLESQSDPKIKDKNYAEIKEMVQFFGQRTSTSTWNNFQKLRSKLKKFPMELGFKFNGSVAGYLEIDAETSVIKEGGFIVIAQADAEMTTPIYPPIFVKFTLSGNAQGGFKFVLTEIGQLGLDGSLDFSLTAKAGIEANVVIANAYTGISGTIGCSIDSFNDPIPEAFTAIANIKYFLDLGILLWGKTFEYEFNEWELYPGTSQNRTTAFSIEKEDLNFIEPLDQVSTYASDPDAFITNIQTYCQPQIIDLGNGTMLMVYIADASYRSAEDRTILMYSYYDGSWNAPEPVWDDGTCDFAPQICSDGNGGAYIVWQNAVSDFEANVTLDEMASEMDLYYAHWNNGITDYCPVTDGNYDYEMAHTIAANGDNISVVWEQNSENDPFGINGTNAIFRRQFINGEWQNTEKLADEVMLVNSLESQYVDGINLVAYSAKTTNDTSTLDDTEIFYALGGETDPIQITDNSVADYSLSFAGKDLFWISGNSVMSVYGFGQPDERITNLAQNASKVKAISNTAGEKAIVWTQDDGTNTQFFASFYNDSADEYGVAMPITEGDDVIRNWDACLQDDGTIQLSYSAADYLDEPVDGKPYGQLDLIQKAGNTFCDIAVDSLSTYDGEIVPESEITLTTNVYNTGSQAINQFDVTILDSAGNSVKTVTVDKQLGIGESTQIEVPFTLPSSISLSDYTVKILPHGKTDAFQTNNESQFTIGYADLAITEVIETGNLSERQLNITVQNQGYDTIEAATLKVLDGGAEGDVLSTYTLTQLDPGEETTFTYTIPSNAFAATTSEEPAMFYLLAETETEEASYGNNTYEMFVYPNCTINVSAENGGTVLGSGTYIYGTEATLTATPADGYIFAGWYEDGKLLDGLTEQYAFTVLSNRTLEAKFMPNDLTVTDVDIFGTLTSGNELTFTATAEGGNAPYQYKFYIYKEDELCYSDNQALSNFCAWTPDSTGNYEVVVQIFDSTGFSATYTKEFTITS